MLAINGSFTVNIASYIHNKILLLIITIGFHYYVAGVSVVFDEVWVTIKSFLFPSVVPSPFGLHLKKGSR